MWWYYLPSPCYLVVPGAPLVHRSPPTIEELLWTIRDAWPPPRSLSLDSEKRERPRQPLEAMGTGSKGKSGSRMGLPFRRYSVPEIVMRKYSLSRAQTSASDIVTAPTPSVPSISTSQESKTTKRMSHKACQTSPPNNYEDTQSSTCATGSLSFESELPVIPTVTIIEETTDSNGNTEQEQKHSSSSNEYSQSEDIKCYSARDRRVYKSDSSLPGAVAQPGMFLTVPEVLLDPHECPQEGGEEEVFASDIIKCIVQTPSVLSSDKMVDTGDASQENNLRELTPTQLRENHLQSGSNSVHESPGPLKMVERRASTEEEDYNRHMTENEINIDLGDSISPEGTATPAPTCHTFDSQANRSECYITDCDLCTAEGRKCCSLDDSGSQSCSFTSPEMLTTNELKTSSDYTTSSMTLDQSVSDRTTSTQDSTVSLTSISPESEEAKTKLSGVNISPILVIDSEAMLTDMVFSQNKNQNKKSSNSSATSSRPRYDSADPSHLSNTFPAVISSETALLPGTGTTMKQNERKDESTENIDSKSEGISLPEKSQNQTYSELNNNKLLNSLENNSLSKKTIADEFGSHCISDENQETNNTSQGNALNNSSNEHESSKAQNDDQRKIISYSTNYLYLTESGSSLNNIQSNLKPNTENYTTNYLYLTESDSGSSQLQNDEEKHKGENYSTNFLYLTESSESQSSKNKSESEVNNSESKPFQGNYDTNYMYLTEETSSSQVPESSSESEIQKQKGDSYKKNFLYLTEESNSSQVKNSRADVKLPDGNYSKNFLYLSESESKSSNTRSETLPSSVELAEITHPPTGNNVTNALYLTESEHRSSQSKNNNEQPKPENYSTNFLYLTESESGSSPNNHSEQPKSENYSKNFLYLTETESGSSQSVNNNGQPKTGNYSTNFLYLTETDSASSQSVNNNGQPKTGNYSTNFLYLTESESGSSPKNNYEQPKTGNYSTNFLYLTESESGSSPKNNDEQPKTGNYSTNFLYLTESESGSSPKNNDEQPKTGNYSTNFLYLTESESGSGSSQTKKDGMELKTENYSTNYLYLTESDTGSSKAQESNVESNDAQKRRGDEATNVFYMTEEDSVTSCNQNENTERSTKQNHGKCTSNYLYLTEDESGMNPDSLDMERISSKESEFEMDSLALNESTKEESKLLENLGFSETYLKAQNETGAAVVSESLCEEYQQKFYGNEKYELVLKDVERNNKDAFLGNVMPVSDEKRVPSTTEPKISPKTAISGLSPFISDEGELNNLWNRECGIDISQISSERETSMGSVAGGTYWELPGKELVIPRFSAMPRTLSMIVNTSSVDCSSDSDLSLADSLEDSKSDEKSKGLKLYNKYDNRPARGDVIALLPEESSAPKKPSSTAHAYFLSLTGEEGEIKIEHIPDELRQKLLKRYNEVKKHSDHSPGHDSRKKKKSSSKKCKKYHHHSCSPNKTDISPKSSDQTSKSSECQGTIDKKGKTSTCTQWEDLGSSKESSDTLVPSDFSGKDKDNIFEGDYKAKNVSTSPYDLDKLQEGNQRNLHNWLENLTKSNNIDINNIANKTSLFKDSGTSTVGEKDSHLEEKNNTNQFVNSWVQCENMPHVDNILDEEISKLLIKNLKNDESTPERGKFKCSEHQVPWFKDIDIQVSENDLIEDKIAENAQRIIQIQSYETDLNSLVTSSVQTDEDDLKKSNSEDLTSTKTTAHPDESNKIKLNLNVSPTNSYDEDETGNKYFEDDGKEKNNILCSEKVTFATHKQQEKIVFSKHTTKFNMKTVPSRRPGNLSSRFKQKFEVIPEEKSGSMESSNDERKSPKLVRGRRASIPSDMTLSDFSKIKQKSSGSSSSSNDKNDNEDCDHIRNIKTSPLDGSDYHRRHTIHGNLASRKNNNDMVNNSSFEKNEQSRRHTIHGSLALNSKNEAMLKQLNLLGGTLLKGRVFGKQSGVMFGRFRPINEETQVQKDERSLVEEHLERLRMDTSKGREALAVAKAEEQEDLTTLSKGWINFYLLRDSQDLNSEGSNGEEGSHEQDNVDKSRRAPPAMKTVTVMGKPEEEVRHQYTVHINASPEVERLPDLGPSHKSKTPSLSLSPDLTLPDITPSSSPTTSPPIDLPHIHPRPPTRTKRSISDKNKHKSKRPPEAGDRKEKVHSIENEQNMRYLKLSSVKQELQTEQTFFARSGEVACSELSPSSQSSSSVMVDSPTLPSIKWPSRQLQRRAPRHSRHPHSHPHHPSSSQACWTVTLAGSSGHPTQPPPDVEMRLSFSNAARGPPTSQSDSGLGEDGPCERRTKQQALPPALPQNNQWKVMMKRQQQETDRSSDQTKSEKKQSLQDFNYTPSTARTKKNSKNRGQEGEDRPVSVKVQEILEHNISLHKSSLTEEEWTEGLSVTGLAITPERKPRVPTMSERDLTRQWLHRTRLSQ